MRVLSSQTWLWYPNSRSRSAASVARAFTRAASSATWAAVCQCSAGRNGSITVVIPSAAAASKIASGVSDPITGAWPDGAVTPAAANARRYSSVRS